MKKRSPQNCFKFALTYFIERQLTYNKVFYGDSTICIIQLSYTVYFIAEEDEEEDAGQLQANHSLN